MYDEILQAVINMAASAVGASIVVGSNPPASGIAMSGSANTRSVFLDIGSDEIYNIVCNSKNGNQKTAIQQLDTIHRALTKRKDFPCGDGWQIYAIETVASPRLIGRESSDRVQWIYASSLLVKINTKGI